MVAIQRYLTHIINQANIAILFNVIELIRHSKTKHLLWKVIRCSN